jgi:hypothetical protein
MPQFQPLSGPGFKVNKPAATVQQIRDELQRRIAELPGGSSIAVPPIVPADRGRWSANWRVEDWSGVPADRKAAVQEEVVAVMRAFESGVGPFGSAPDRWYGSIFIALPLDATTS